MFDIEKAKAKSMDGKTIEIMEKINENTRRRETCAGHKFDVTKFAPKHKCLNCGCEESIEYIHGYTDGLKHAALKDRKTELLKACLALFKKQIDSPYVLNLLCETVHYDEADCDGYSLIEDIEGCLEETDGD